MKVKFKNRKYLLVIIILIFISIILIINNYNTPENRLKRQLELGHKYLLEQNYDEAIVAFCKVIELDPSIKEAYFKLSEIYIHNKDYEQAKAILEEGYKIINNDEFLTRLNELEELIIKEDIEKFKIDNMELAEQIIVEYKLENYNKACEISNILLNNAVVLMLLCEKDVIYIETEEGNIGLYNSKDSYNVMRLYCGDYENKIRQGTGLYVNFNPDKIILEYAVGEWKNDKPNGHQKEYRVCYGGITTEEGYVMDLIIRKEGCVIDGIWDGKVEYQIDEDECLLNFDNGKVQVIEYNGSRYMIGKGERMNHFCDENDLKLIYGMFPFGYGERDI